MARCAPIWTGLCCVALAGCVTGLEGGDATTDAAVDAATAMPAYVGRVGTDTGAGSGASVRASGNGVGAGHAILVALLLSTSSPTGTVSASDNAGNTYVVDGDWNDGRAGDRVVILSSLGTRALPGGNLLSISFPKASGYHVCVDEFSGVTTRDQSAGSAGTARDFTSGALVTTHDHELLYGTVGVETGAAPAWLSGWSMLPDVAVTNDHLASAYQVAAAPGNYAAAGNVQASNWMAGITSYR